MTDTITNNAIAVRYNLPEKWNDGTSFSFDHLSEVVLQLHDSAYSSAVKAINRFATVRNYVIGYYIVEFEQHGSDRAKYGDRLLKRLADKVNKRGINETLLKNCRRFYLNYPQVLTYLEGKSATPSHKYGISPMASDFSKDISPTSSDKFVTPAENVITKLSFSHIVEIMTVDDPFARFFYETECIHYADLVFYNRILHCNVIIELKDDEFRHADLSQLNAYVSYYRENEMNEGDNPPIGILLCTRKGEKMVEYALAGMDNQLFVSTYMLALPDKKTLQDFLLREVEK